MEEIKNKEDGNGSRSAYEKAGGKEDISGPSDSSPSPSAGYFDSLFPVFRAVANEFSSSDVQPNSSENGTDVQSGMSHKKNAGKVTQSSPARRETADKDVKLLEVIDSNELSYFSSSVNYGAREYYGSEHTKSYKIEDEQFGNKNIADRGEWWQGSFYYLGLTKLICLPFKYRRVS